MFIAEKIQNGRDCLEFRIEYDPEPGLQGRLGNLYAGQEAES